MATFTKVRAHSSAVVLTLVVALSLAGAGLAHAAPRITKPAVPLTCVWSGPTTQGNLLAGGLVDGYYLVAAQTDSCNTSLHRGLG